MGLPAYPLESLLTVRTIRTDTARRALSAAEEALHESDALLEQRRQELAAYEAWWPREQERRYASIMGKPQTVGSMDCFRAGLARLKEGVLVYKAAVDEAAAQREARAQECEAARRAVILAEREASKIGMHKDAWMAEARQETERREELELEDFHPVLFRGEAADDV